ncbi:MAG TPA: hypothetical protein DHV85_10260, partial [Candidatus Accumulibacter sp.]|nr:hypothetical protein [Accumulibacter sp.]
VIERLRLGRVEIGDHAHPDGKAATVVEALAASISSDGVVYRLAALSARVSGLAVTADASLAGDQPYALAASANIEGEAA